MKRAALMSSVVRLCHPGGVNCVCCFQTFFLSCGWCSRVRWPETRNHLYNRLTKPSNLTSSHLFARGTRTPRSQERHLLGVHTVIEAHVLDELVLQEDPYVRRGLKHLPLLVLLPAFRRFSSPVSEMVVTPLDFVDTNTINAGNWREYQCSHHDRLQHDAINAFTMLNCNFDLPSARLSACSKQDCAFKIAPLQLQQLSQT